MKTPRFDEWTALRTNGQWTKGVPSWARDHMGRMNDMDAARAVIGELAAELAKAERLLAAATAVATHVRGAEKTRGAVFKQYFVHPATGKEMENAANVPVSDLRKLIGEVARCHDEAGGVFTPGEKIYHTGLETYGEFVMVDPQASSINDTCWIRVQTGPLPADIEEIQVTADRVLKV